jgi:hypothetical protein
MTGTGEFVKVALRDARLLPVQPVQSISVHAQGTSAQVAQTYFGGRGDSRDWEPPIRSSSTHDSRTNPPSAQSPR